MFTLKQTLIKILTISALCFSSASVSIAQEAAQTSPSQASSQNTLKAAQSSLEKKAKQSEKWTQDKLKATRSNMVQANERLEALQRKALPLRQKIEAKIPKGDIPGENMFQSIMKKTSAPAIFVGLAFIFAVWILGFATSPGRD